MRKRKQNENQTVVATTQNKKTTTEHQANLAILPLVTMIHSHADVFIHFMTFLADIDLVHLLTTSRKVSDELNESEIWLEKLGIIGIPLEIIKQIPNKRSLYFRLAELNFFNYSAFLNLRNRYLIHNHYFKFIYDHQCPIKIDSLQRNSLLLKAAQANNWPLVENLLTSKTPEPLRIRVTNLLKENKSKNSRATDYQSLERIREFILSSQTQTNLPIPAEIYKAIVNLYDHNWGRKSDDYNTGLVVPDFSPISLKMKRDAWNYIHSLRSNSTAQLTTNDHLVAFLIEMAAKYHNEKLVALLRSENSSAPLTAQTVKYATGITKLYQTLQDKINYIGNDIHILRYIFDEQQLYNDDSLYLKWLNIGHLNDIIFIYIAVSDSWHAHWRQKSKDGVQLIKKTIDQNSAYKASLDRFRTTQWQNDESDHHLLDEIRTLLSTTPLFQEYKPDLTLQFDDNIIIKNALIYGNEHLAQAIITTNQQDPTYRFTFETLKILARYSQLEFWSPFLEKANIKEQILLIEIFAEAMQRILYLDSIEEIPNIIAMIEQRTHNISVFICTIFNRLFSNLDNNLYQIQWVMEKSPLKKLVTDKDLKNILISMHAL